MNTLGMIGGLSWHSTVEYYQYVNQTVNYYFGNNTNPPLVLVNVNQKANHDFQKQNRWDSIAAMLSDAAVTLEKAGAKAIVFCANTPHKVYDLVQASVHIPILHIADATGEQIKKDHLKKVGMIGTLYTMRENFITSRLKDKYAVDVIVPEDPHVQEELQRIIEEELTFGRINPASKKYILDQLQQLIDRGARGIILGCTEFPLIIKPEDLNVPSYNTTALHAMMAVNFILNGNAVPATVR